MIISQQLNRNLLGVLRNFFYLIDWCSSSSHKAVQCQIIVMTCIFILLHFWVVCCTGVNLSANPRQVGGQSASLMVSLVNRFATIWSKVYKICLHWIGRYHSSALTLHRSLLYVISVDLLLPAVLNNPNFRLAFQCEGCCSWLP